MVIRTYSATRSEIFDVQNTPSDVGLLSERFRSLSGVQRSEHPIFSVCGLGDKACEFLNTRSDDCFGKGTVFDLLYENDVKIVTLGCSFDRVTFAHFVEQSLNVPYRYFKTFKGEIKNTDVLKKVDVRFFVRDLDMCAELDLGILETRALAQEVMRRQHFGRFLARVISAQTFFDVASDLISVDKFSLVKKIKE